MPGPVTSHHILVSGYSTGSADHGDTLQLLTPDTTDPFGWKLADSLALISPTFGAYDRVRQILYTSHSAQTFLSAIVVDRAKDTLRLLNSVQIGTVNPAHLSLSADRNFLLAASFTSGHVSVTEVKQTGELGRVIALMSTEAHGGPLKVQTGSQPHQVVSSVNGRHVFVPDRGCDRILIYRFDQSVGSLEPLSAVKTRPGSGPRHMTFHPFDPTVAYVVNELDSSVSIFRWDDKSEQLVFVRFFSSIPSTFIGPNSAAEIEVTRDGRFLFVSNRGHDSIARYALSPDHLELECLGWTPVEGCTPRFIGLNIGEDELWVTAQDSDRVQRFNLKPDTGELFLSGSYAFPSPAFVAFV